MIAGALRGLILAVLVIAFVVIGFNLTYDAMNPTIPPCSDAVAEAHGICQGPLID